MEIAGVPLVRIVGNDILGDSAWEHVEFSTGWHGDGVTYRWGWGYLENTSDSAFERCGWNGDGIQVVEETTSDSAL